jgi:signal peptidase I
MNDIRNRPALQWLLFGGLLAGIYFFINLALPRLPLNALVSAFIVQPLLWGALAFLVWRYGSYRPAVRVKGKSSYLQLALIIGFVQVMAYVIAGLFSGFGKSPTAFTPTGILGDLAYVAGTLAGAEFCRAWLVNRLGRRHQFLAVLLISLLFAILSQPLGKISGFAFSIKAIPDLSATWLPALGESLMASMLVLFGGPSASLIYRGLLAAFWWFCPILPDLAWSYKTLIGVLAPILGMVAANWLVTFQGVHGQHRQRFKKESFPTSTILVAVFIMFLAWFSSGALPFLPLVVPTGSMIPVFYPGDVVIIAKIPAEKVKLGDIVEYANPEIKINIVHRVIEMQGSGEQKSFIVKGDNNNSPDSDPVTSQQVIGKVVFQIPKIGWVSLYLKTLFSGG